GRMIALAERTIGGEKRRLGAHGGLAAVSMSGLLLARHGLLGRSLLARSLFRRTFLARKLLRRCLLGHGLLGGRTFRGGSGRLHLLLAGRVLRGGSSLRSGRLGRQRHDLALAAGLAELLGDRLAEIGRALHGGHACALQRRKLV